MTSQSTHSHDSTAASNPPVEKAPDVDPGLERVYEALSLKDRQTIPWQYYGYPALSKWMASANDFLVLRRFSPLQVRCLLYLQNEIAIKDRELQAWDRYARTRKAAEGDSGALQYDPDTLPNNPRPRIIREVIPLLKEYNDLVDSFSKLKAKETASNHQFQNIHNWFESHGNNAIKPREQHFREHQGDLITLLPGSKYPLVTFVYSIPFIRRMFKLPMRDDRIESDLTTYESNTASEAFATFLSLFIGLGMTFGAIWWLNFVNSNVHRLAIITVAGTILALITWAAAGNKPFEILAAFAAYMAVLMIYRQVGSS